MKSGILQKAVLVAIVMAAAASGLTGSANAATIGYCGNQVGALTFCPNNTTSSHPRHTYKNNRVSWTFDIRPGCDVYVDQDLFLAYENSNGYNKYGSGACNYVADSYPDNTDFLRPYASHQNFGSQNLLFGRADY